MCMGLEWGWSAWPGVSHVLLWFAFFCFDLLFFSQVIILFPDLASRSCFISEPFISILPSISYRSLSPYSDRTSHPRRKIRGSPTRRNYLLAGCCVTQGIAVLGFVWWFDSGGEAENTLGGTAQRMRTMPVSACRECFLRWLVVRWEFSRSLTGSVVGFFWDRWTLWLGVLRDVKRGSWWYSWLFVGFDIVAMTSPSARRL